MPNYFQSSPDFSQKYVNLDNDAIVRQFYRTVLASDG